MYNKTKPNYSGANESLGFEVNRNSSTGETSSSTYVTSNSQYGVFNAQKNDFKPINQASYYSPTKLKEEQPASISSIPIPRTYTSNNVNANSNYGQSPRYLSSNYTVNSQVSSLLFISFFKVF
jgi:hypothetical protein